jgi:hypothetical protein
MMIGLLFRLHHGGGTTTRNFPSCCAACGGGREGLYPARCIIKLLEDCLTQILSEGMIVVLHGPEGMANA